MSVEQERRQASERVATLHLTRTAGGYLYIWPCPPHDRDDLGDYLDVMIRSLTQEVEMLGDVIVTGYDWEEREGPTLDGLPLGWVFFLITLFTRELVSAPDSTEAHEETP